MFRLQTDGSAVVEHFPIVPFLPVQHFQMDVTTVNRLANHCLRFARAHGWLQPADGAPPSTLVTETSGSEGKDSRSNSSQPRADSTVFYAGMESELTHRTLAQQPLSITPCHLLHSHLFVSHVGNSSYGILIKLSAYHPERARTKDSLGTFKVTCVYVSRALRRPMPIPPAVRQLYMEHHRRGASGLQAIEAQPTVVRLDVKDLMTHLTESIEWPCAHSSQVHPRTTNGCRDVSMTYKRTYRLRENDMDFNLHLNQLTTLQLVIDAFRGALADPFCAISRLLPMGMRALEGDRLLRKVRIDYIQEVPMTCAGLVVFLFIIGSDAKTRICLDSSVWSHGEVVDVGFCSKGVRDSGEYFLSTAGVMYAEL